MTDEHKRERLLPPLATWGRTIQDWVATGDDPHELLRNNLEQARAEADAGRPDEARRRLQLLRSAVPLAERAANLSVSPRVAILLGLGAVSLAALARLEPEGTREELSRQAADLYLSVADKAMPELTARDRAELGLALAVAGHLDRAGALLEGVSADDSQWGLLGLDLGAAFERHGDTTGAAAIYLRAFELARDEPEVLERLADALQGTNRAVPAAEALYRAAVALARAGRTAESHRLLDRGLADGLPRTGLLELKVSLLGGAGESERALELLDRFADEGGEPPRLLVARALCLLELGRAEEALAAARKARADASGESSGALVEALVLEALDRGHEAIEALEVASGMDADNAIIHATKANVQARLGLGEEALDSIDRALALDPLLNDALVLRSTILRLQGDTGQALEAVRAVLSREPDDAAALAELGECLLALGGEEDAEEAVTALVHAVALRPGNAWTTGTLGQAYVRAGRVDEGIEHLRQASALDPRLIWARDMLEAALLDRGDPLAALAVLDALIDDHTAASASTAARAGWYARRGEALRQLGSLSEASRNLERSLELAPGDAYALGTLGQVLISWGRVEEGIGRLREAARDRLPPAWVMRELISTLLDRGREEEALAALADAHERGLARSTTLVLLEEVMLRSEDQSRLLERVEDWRRRQPDWEAASVIVARLLAELGRRDDALREVDGVLAADADWADALQTRCMILAALGRVDEAHATIDRVLEPQPASEPFLRAKLSLLDAGGQLAEMLAVIDRALAEAPREAWLYRDRAAVLGRLGRAEEAGAALTEMATLRPDPGVIEVAATEVRELLGPDAATKLLEDLLPQVHTPDRQVAIAAELFILDRTVEALDAVDATLANVPDHGGANRLRGQLLVRRRRPVDALGALLHGIAQPPASPQDIAYVGYALAAVGRYEAAIAWLDRALADDAGIGDAIATRAAALQYIGRHEAALSAWTAAVEAMPDDGWCLKGVADCLILLGRRPEATPRLMALIDRPLPETSAWHDHALRGWCHYRLEHFDEACEEYIEALALDNLSLSSQFDLALATLCGGQGRRALAEYQRGIDTTTASQPQAAPGWFAAARKELQDAGAEWRTVRELDAFERVAGFLDAASERAEPDLQVRLARLDLRVPPLSATARQGSQSPSEPSSGLPPVPRTPPHDR